MVLTKPTPTTAEDLPGLRRLDEIAFHFDISDETWKRVSALFSEMHGYAVREGDQIVGHAGAYDMRMTVPGGKRPVAGVTGVEVLPTHRRRGVLRSLMRRQIDDLHEAGTSLAVLWASEAGIYGRFGYGLASRLARTTVPRAHRGLRAVPGTDGIALELLEMSQAEATCRDVYARAVPLRPGMAERTDALHRSATSDDPEHRSGSSRLRCVLARASASGEALGYAWFAVKSDWTPAGPAGSTHVRELISLDAPSGAALVAFLCDIDLTTETRFADLPVDHQLFRLLVEPHRSPPTLSDQLWTRLIDVGAALSSRTYAVDVDARLEVRDEFCGWNAGVWHLTGGPSGATCVRTADAPDLVLDVRELGAAYLGDMSLHWATAAGLVEERAPGASATVSRALAHTPLPWCSFVF